MKRAASRAASAGEPVRKKKTKKKTGSRPIRAGRGRPPKTRQSEDTRQLILDAAERLFSQHGFYGVTTREVAKSAGVDTALLHYYFTSKRGLFDSVFGRRGEILNKLRMESLDQYERQSGGNPSIEGVMDAFIRPLVDAAADGGQGWRNYFALVAQVNNAPDWGGETMTRYFDPVVHRFIDMLCPLLPGVPEEDVYWCYQQLTGSITLTLSQTGRIDRLSNGICHSSNLRSAYARMVPYAAAGFRAMLKQVDSARLRTTKRSRKAKRAAAT